MSTEHLILGWIKKYPSHGYMLKKCYQEFINPDEKLNDAKLYPMLRDMEERGLITKATEDREVGPSRKVISITKKGTRVFEEWLRGDKGEGYSSRPRYDFFRAFPFLVKYAFFYDLDRETAQAKVETQLATHRAKLEDYRGARGKMVEKGLETCKVQALDFGIMLEETIIRWLEEKVEYYRKLEPAPVRKEKVHT